MRPRYQPPRYRAVARRVRRVEILPPQLTTAPALDPPFVPAPDVRFGPAEPAAQPDPYLDYDRCLTPEGGVRLTYKDIDLRLRHKAWRAFAFSVATGFEAWLLFDHAPLLQNHWIVTVAFLLAAVLNGVILWKPPQLYRAVEVRPDCLIVEDKDLFLLALMENGWPAFKRDKDGNQVLCGLYGTRFVEYLTVRRFDDEDRMPEVFASHLQEAMKKAWAPPSRFGTGQFDPPGGQ